MNCPVNLTPKNSDSAPKNYPFNYIQQNYKFTFNYYNFRLFTKHRFFSE